MRRQEMKWFKIKPRGVPVLDIDGSIIIGFNKPAIDEAINL